MATKKRRAPCKKSPVKGRPTKLTEALTKSIEENIAEHCPPKDACVLAGISHRTYQLWRTKAREGGSRNARYIAFFERIEVARATARRALLKELAEGVNIKGEADWKARDRLISRTHPELAQAEVSRKAVELEVQEIFTAMEELMPAEAVSAMYSAYSKVRGISE